MPRPASTPDPFRVTVSCCFQEQHVRERVMHDALLRESAEVDVMDRYCMATGVFIEKKGSGVFDTLARIGL